MEVIDHLVQAGPGLGRPMVDRVHGSHLHNLKELRPGSTGRSEIRLLFIFDAEREAVILVAGAGVGGVGGARAARPFAVGGDEFGELAVT
ncbi:type II toxin-antitoxin system RelE/ParE family toxin [Dactylosporangium fulvum]|uniref:Type II toxin-antitoxin system RelE/ParE family toxin n=2 Tax=Dactylosporangium fulvum TaxID=53359 RepID=A0ABY5VT76_9ACTN|nr:type II toxin-antitoxin system RelE/ParE family toxin [Dactylosporangium fulvum]UWP80963.1 type II toxin-antitoxin system RelE/ParE family toxin [Dactylosporangium fulvum]